MKRAAPNLFQNFTLDRLASFTMLFRLLSIYHSIPLINQHTMV